MNTPERHEGRIWILFILSLAQLFGLSLWFVSNSVIDQLIPVFDLTEQDLSVLSIMVTIGFVVGGLISTLTNVSDVYRASIVFCISAILGGIFNILTLFVADFWMVLLLRFLTGVSLAGIYPVGMKLTASHFSRHRGLAIGILLAALTIGSGLPYIILILGEPPWQTVNIIVSILSASGGILVLLFIDEGPFLGKNRKFQLQAARKILSSRSVQLSILGYYGHMFELYAFWVWFPRMYKASLEQYTTKGNAEVLKLFAIGSFLIFLMGGLANVSGGYIADRIGRTTFNIAMLSLSGLSGIIIGISFSYPTILIIIGIIWGITIIPDSAQYSTMITEVGDQNLVGSALAIQTATGFLLTIVTIYLIPIIQGLFGWQWAFPILSIGPLIGIVAMILLRRHPDSLKIAHGKK